MKNDPGPDAGHTFRITVASRGSYRVAGDKHHHDSPSFFDPSHAVDVRAWDLRTALHMVAELPLDDWFPEGAQYHWEVKPARQIDLDDLRMAVESDRLTLDQALDAAYSLGRTGLPREYYEALFVEEE